MRTETVGTLAWADATRGALRPIDRLNILGQAVDFAIHELPAEVLARMGRKAAKAITKSPIEPSDRGGANARAKAVCSRMAPAFLRTHSHRTYLWARLLAADEHFLSDEIDDQLLYICCLLHDLGLSRTYPSLPSERCFTMVGARILREIATAAKWDEDRIRRGEEAIMLHMNPRVPAKQGSEAHLLARASQLDAIGIGNWRIPEKYRQRVLAQYPRDDDQKRGFSALFGFEYHSAKSRARMYRCLGSRWWFYLNP